MSVVLSWINFQSQNIYTKDHILHTCQLCNFTRRNYFDVIKFCSNCLGKYSSFEIGHFGILLSLMRTSSVNSKQLHLHHCFERGFGFYDFDTMVLSANIPPQETILGDG